VTWYDQADGMHHQRVGGGTTSPPSEGYIRYTRVGDGVGFDESGTAYDLDTGAVNYEAPPSCSFVASTPGGGEAVSDGSTLFELDRTGSIVSQTPVDSLTAAGAWYRGGALWIGAGGTGLTLYAGPAISTYGSEYPDENGGNQPKRPRISTFIPVYSFREPPGTDPSSFPQNYPGELAIRLGGFWDNADLSWSFPEESTASRFLDAAEKLPLSALAFIGHSVSIPEPPSNGLAYALQFSGDFLVKELFPQPIAARQGDGSRDLIRQYVSANPAVVFLGACDLSRGPGAEYSWLMDMMWLAPWRNSAQRRALIYGWNPDGGRVDLVGAKVAWSEIVFHLLLGDTVDVAVEAANTAIRSVTTKVGGQDVPIADRYNYWGRGDTTLF